MARFTHFTRHARLRIRQRTALGDRFISEVLDYDLGVQVGEVSITDKVHKLFYSPQENRYFVAIQNVLTGAVITLLPQAYYERLCWKIGAEQLQLATRKMVDAGLQTAACCSESPVCLTQRSRVPLSRQAIQSPRPFGANIDYAATFYTTLARQFARGDRLDHDNTRLVFKEPGTAKGCSAVSHGFYLGTNGRLFYNENGITVVELDGLAIGRESVTSYQYITGKKGQMSEHQRACKKRMNVLRHLFPGQQVRCVIVSDVLTALPSGLQSLGDVTLQVYQPERLLSRHKAEKRLKEIADSEALLPVAHLNYMASDFCYLDKFLAMNRRIEREQVTQILDDITDSESVFSRLYWGSISSGTLARYMDRQPDVEDRVYVSVNVSDATPEIKFYVCREDGALAELSGTSVQPLTRLNSWKQSRQELEAVREQLPHRSDQEFSAFMVAIDKWHSRRLEAKVAILEAAETYALPEAA